MEGGRRQDQHNWSMIYRIHHIFTVAQAQTKAAHEKAMLKWYFHGTLWSEVHQCRLTFMASVLWGKPLEGELEVPGPMGISKKTQKDISVRYTKLLDYIMQIYIYMYIYTVYCVYYVYIIYKYYTMYCVLCIYIYLCVCHIYIYI